MRSATAPASAAAWLGALLAFWLPACCEAAAEELCCELGRSGPVDKHLRTHCIVRCVPFGGGMRSLSDVQGTRCTPSCLASADGRSISQKTAPAWRASLISCRSQLSAGTPAAASNLPCVTNSG